MVAAFIAKHGHETAERYVAHEVVESWKAMQEFQRYAEPLGETPYSDEEVERAREAHDEFIERYGTKLGEPYGWAHAALSAKGPRYVKQRVTFQAVQESVNLEHMRPHYRMASHSVHANPQGITFTSDLPEGEQGRVLLAGASPVGLADAGHGALISLLQVTTTVLASKAGEATGCIIATMAELTDEAGLAYLEAHQTLDVERVFG